MLLLITVIFNGCGSSSSSSKSTTADSIVWEKDVYPDDDLLKDYCEVPRTTNIIIANDKLGSTFLEKMWLRSWSDDVYLWYRELSDIDVELVDTPLDYFATRKTDAITPSGVLKDQFHFSYDTEVYNQQVSSGASLGYGMTFKFLSSSPPREAVVILVEPGSPADEAGVVRGTEILAVDGADFVDGDASILNIGLFPVIENEAHSFEIIEPESTVSRTITINSAVVTEDPVQNTSFITEDDTGEKTGYLTFNTFGTLTAERSLVDAFNYLSDAEVSDLVLDLRYNGGGFLAISAQLAYMIAGPNNTQDTTYYKTVYNDKYPNTDPVSGNQIQPYSFIDTGLGWSDVSRTTSLPTLNLNRVYILSTNSTCSASEALMNGLQGIGVEVILIGDKTCGKPYGFTGTDNCGITYFTVMFKGVNDIGFGDYTDGFYPSNSTSIGSVPIAGCQLADDYYHSLGDPDEAMLSAALQYKDTGTCPATVVAAAKSLDSENIADSINSGADLFDDERVRSKFMLNQILLKDR